MNPGNDWLDAARRLADVVTGALAAPPPDGGTGPGHDADCRWCPVCQAAAVLRGERPEVTAALADVLTSTAAALRAFAEQGNAEPGNAEPAEEPAADEPPPGDPPPTVQRIEIA